MLTEEAHHMFVGNTGISRVIQRTAERMKEGDPRQLGAVPTRYASATHQPMVRAEPRPLR